MNSNWSFSPKTPNLGQNRRFVLAVWPSNLTDDLQNNRAPLLWYFKLCASFRSHWWIQTRVTFQKRPIWVKINDFLSRVTFTRDRWPWKILGHLFYDTLSFVHHFNAIGKFKLKLKSGNAQFGSKSTIFLAVWPRNFTDDPENHYRAPLLCYFKLCESFRSHWWIQIGVTVWKHLIMVKFDNF